MKYLYFLLLPLYLQASPIIISADRFERPLSLATSDTSVVNRDELSVAPQNLLQQLANLGLAGFNRLGGAGQPISFYLRGNSSEDILYLIDGVEINDPSDAGRGAATLHLNLADIERIEIIRGAGSAIYGSDALGGVINIITRAPTDKIKAHSSMNIGSFKQRGTTHSYQQKNLKLHYSHQASEGFSLNSSGSSPDGHEQNQARIHLDHQFEKFKIHYQSQFFRTDNQLDRGGEPGADDPNYFSHNQLWLNDLQVTGDRQGIYQGNYRISHTQNDRRFQNLPDDQDASTVRDRYQSELIKLQKTGRFFWSENFESTAILEFEQEQAQINTHNDFAKDNISERQQTFSLSAHQSWYRDIYLMEYSARFDQVRDQNNLSAFTYRIAPGILLAQNSLKLYTQLASGYKAPTLFQKYSQIGSLDLESEKNLSWDFNLQYKNKHSETHLSYFHNRLDNLVDYNFALNQYFNQGASEIQGLEWRQSWNLNPMKIHFNYTHQLARNINDGQHLLGRSRNLFNTGFSWESSMGSFHYAYNYLGGRAGFQSQLAASSYSLLSWQSPRIKTWQLSLDWQNIFNETVVMAQGFNSLPSMVILSVQKNWF